MRDEADRAVEILERKQRETQLELLELVEELRRERDAAREQVAELKRDLATARELIRAHQQHSAEAA